ncbi:MAG: nitroreductase family protein [Fibrobacteria bacterium]|nr:nitroreductase family protein [Fibrobacteria bacterium]
MNVSEFRDLCLARRSVRSFSSRPVDESSIQNILDCAKSIPYASARRGWDVVVVRDRSVIRNMAQVVRDASARLTSSVREGCEVEWDSYRNFFHAFETAPLLFVPVFRDSPVLSALVRDPDARLRSFDRENHLKSIAGAIPLILLAALSEGLVSCPMTGPLLAADSLASLMGLRRGLEIAALIPVGHPAAPENPPS